MLHYNCRLQEIICYLEFKSLYCFGCLQILEDEKVHEMLTVGEYPLYLIPLDEDVLSFELDLAYKVCWLNMLSKESSKFYVLKIVVSNVGRFFLQECAVNGDTTSLWHIAKSIHKLEV